MLVQYMFHVFNADVLFPPSVKMHVVAPQEDDYIPLVKEFISLQKQFEKPFGAGNAIARQQNKKPSTKAKAKAKAKASA